MKRSRYLLGLVLFFGVICSAYSQRAEVSVTLKGQRVKVLLSLEDINGDDLIASLERNQRVQIDFVLKAFVKSGKFRVFNSSLLKEVSVVYSADWNPVVQIYTIEGGGVAESFTDSKAFLNAFLGHVFRFDVSITGKERIYVSCRIKLNTFKLLPPFVILEPFFKGSTITTPWIRRDITQ